MKLKILLHSYTFREHPFQEACKAAHDFGYDAIELSRVHFDDNRLDAELPPAMKIAESEGVPIACVDFAADLINPDNATREDSIALLKKNIAICAEHGISLMNGYIGVLTGNSEDFGQNGSTLATDAHYNRAAAALQPIADFAADRNVKLSLEIHMNTIHDTIASTIRLLDQVDRKNILATPDPGNMYATSTAERDPQSLRALRGKIGLFHFKNCTDANGNIDFSVALANGLLDPSPYLHLLHELGYTADLCIEHVGELDPRTVASRDIDYLKECMKRATNAT